MFPMDVQVYSHPHVSDGCLLINGPILVTFAVAVFFSRVGEIECSESCKFSNDGYCDDGDFGSDYDLCAVGTDCMVGLPSTNALSNNCRFVSELSPPHTTFSCFSNTPSSDGRTVAHALATQQVTSLMFPMGVS
jgi:hypothetical protein